MSIMVIPPPIKARDESAEKDSAPRIDLALSHYDLSTIAAPPVFILAPLELGFLFKPTARNPWFFLLLMTSLFIHASLMLASSLWNKQSVAHFGEEPIPVELIMEAADTRAQITISDPPTEHVLEQPTLEQLTSYPIAEPMSVEPVSESTRPQPNEPSPVFEIATPLAAQTSVEAKPLPEPDQPVGLPEQTPTPQDETPKPVPELEIRHEEPNVIEAAPAPIPAPSQPQAAPQPQPAKPTPIRKPTAAPSQPRQAAISDTRLADFRANLSRKLASAFRYPTMARERNKTGTVSVSFELDANGNVTKASVVQSSGHDELDADALATIRRAAPFEPPPQGAPRSYTFPIAYRLR
jgi:TonB family protein